MSIPVKYFSWSIPRFKVILAHVANQERSSNGFNGQTQDNVLTSDMTFYNTQQEFKSNNINKRNLVGSAGIYPKLYAHAECLRSQFIQFGRPESLLQLNYKSMGIPGVSVSKDRDPADDATVFDHLISIANKQIEVTSDPSRMTFQEKLNYDKQGTLQQVVLKLHFC